MERERSKPASHHYQRHDETAHHPTSPLHDWLMAEQQQRRLDIGVSFRDVDCYGYRASTQYQSTFITTLIKPFQLLRGKSQKVTIIQKISGLVKPGEMLLVLGRPGSGCSTFLKTLAGDTHGFQLDSESKINYQGISFDQMHRDFKGERIYLAELDVHFPELTLGQALSFATSMRRHETLSSRYNEEPAKNSAHSLTLAQLFNLIAQYNTPIGDVNIRGISGGEKRRTSIAEAYVAGARLQCWDNSTRGLDSSTARQFIQVLRETTNALRSTLAMSLYQASEGMYQCFDKVMLLYEGREIYFGPIDQAESYFTAMGFLKPSRATTPDFLTSLTSPTERLVREGWEDWVPRSPDEFAYLWQQKAIQHKNSEGKEKLSLRGSTFPLSLMEQTIFCLRRAYQRLLNNYLPVISAILANSILGLILGSAFSDLRDDSGDMGRRSILTFYATMINAFVPAFEVEIMWAQRHIVEKQDHYAFYRPFVERLAHMLSDFPSKFALSILLHPPIYFLSNLRRTPAAFLTYWLIMFINLMMMAMLFRMLGSVLRSRDATITPVSIVTLLCVLYTGFVIPPPYMVSWLGWFRHVNPVAYAYEALMINEFYGRQFPCSNLIPNGPSYDGVEKSAKLCLEIGSDRETSLVDGYHYILQRYGYEKTHPWSNIDISFAMMAVFCIVHLLAVQYIPAQKSRGEVLLFKKTPHKDKIDTETGDTESFVQSLVTHKNVMDTHILTNPSLGRTSTPVLHWSRLTYDIKVGKDTRRILNKADGWLQPGSLTVLMGFTGAGKTTLLDVLADRASAGRVCGNIFVDGVHREKLGSFQRRIGYVQQSDIHLPTATVREALQFGSLLRQSHSRAKHCKLQDVEDVLSLLEMESYADAVVGIPGEGLNVEQRRRLSIALEMVATPDLVLFLDEPTSGLDSQTAWSICMLMRKLVDNGQTVLCTINQPSSQVFNQFDRLLLLKNGQTVYFGEIGPDAEIVTRFFEARGARKCLTGDNPAEWLIDTINVHPDIKGDKAWANEWRNSVERQVVSQQLDELEWNTDGSVQSRLSKHNCEFASPFLQQLTMLLVRVFRDQCRSPYYLYTQGISFLIGFSVYNTDDSIQGVTNLLFSAFLESQPYNFLTIMIVPRFAAAHNLFEAREHSSKAYSWLAFVAANIIIEIAWLVVVAFLIFVAWYYPTGFHRNGDPEFSTLERGGISFLLISLFAIWVGTLAQAATAAIEQPEAAIQLVLLSFWLAIVPPKALPGFWIFMYRISPLTYFLEGLAIAGLSGVAVACSDGATRHSTALRSRDVRGISRGICGKIRREHHRSGGYQRLLLLLPSIWGKFDTARPRLQTDADLPLSAGIMGLDMIAPTSQYLASGLGFSATYATCDDEFSTFVAPMAPMYSSGILPNPTLADPWILPTSYYLQSAEATRSYALTLAPHVVRGRNHTFSNDRREPLIHTAARGNDVATLQLLKQAGFDINERDSEGRTPLLAALEESHVEAFVWLLEAGVDVNVVDKHGRTALSMTVNNKCPVGVKLTLTHGAKVDPIHAEQMRTFSMN
ncbi:ABC multidrug transporter atrG [Paramyrothecium foliicola]|nr:ABC multidrug transporter atrG [Paramyrothecium foliicola]